MHGPADPGPTAGGRSSALLTPEETWRDYHLRLRTTCGIDATVVVCVFGLTRLMGFPGLYGSRPAAGDLLAFSALLFIALIAAVNELHFRRRRLSATAHLYGLGGVLYLGNLVAVMILVHRTGGVESVFFLLYFTLALVGSYMGPADLIVPMSLIGIGMHGVLLWLDHRGLIDRYPSGLLTLAPGVSRDRVALLAFALNATMTLLYVAFGRRLFRVLASQREQLAYARLHLEQRVEERTQELAGALHQLRAAMDSLAAEKKRLEQFFAQVTHRFRTPLQVLTGATSNLRAGIYGPITPRQGAVLDQVDASTEELSNLIGNILDAKKIQAGEMEVAVGPVAVRDEIERLVAKFRLPAEIRGVQLLWAVDADVPARIETDRTKLETILANLLHNAVKFSKNAPVRVTAHARPEEAAVVFRVEDRGKGIAPENHERIFEAYKELDRHPEFRGSGLGLYIARTLARMMDGDIRVASEPGKGAVFELRLPVATRTPTPGGIGGGGRA